MMNNSRSIILRLLIAAILISNIASRPSEGKSNSKPDSPDHSNDSEPEENLVEPTRTVNTNPANSNQLAQSNPPASIGTALTSNPENVHPRVAIGIPSTADEPSGNTLFISGRLGGYSRRPRHQRSRSPPSSGTPPESDNPLEPPRIGNPPLPVNNRYRHGRPIPNPYINPDLPQPLPHPDPDSPVPPVLPFIPYHPYHYPYFPPPPYPYSPTHTFAPTHPYFPPYPYPYYYPNAPPIIGDPPVPPPWDGSSPFRPPRNWYRMPFPYNY